MTVITVSCNYDLTRCRNEAQIRFDEYVADPSQNKYVGSLFLLIYLFPFCLSDFLSFCLSVCLSFFLHLFFRTFSLPFFFLFFEILSVCLCAFLSVCLFLSLSFFLSSFRFYLRKIEFSRWQSWERQLSLRSMALTTIQGLKGISHSCYSWLQICVYLYIDQ